jgi:hypothetical protein
MNREAAAQIVPMLVRAATEAAATVHVYRQFAGDVEVKPYSDAIGALVSAHHDILARIVHEHPDLDPGGFSV